MWLVEMRRLKNGTPGFQTLTGDVISLSHLMGAAIQYVTIREMTNGDALCIPFSYDMPEEHPAFKTSGSYTRMSMKA